MAWFDTFLADREPRRWMAAEGLPAAINAGQVFLQDADYGLEVAVGEAAKRPTTADMRRAWTVRHGGRPSPVLLVVGYPDAGGIAVAVCGPAGENPPVYFDLDISRIERLSTAALAEPTRHAAQRCLLRLLPELDSELPGIVNSGLLASHELRYGVPLRADWEAATAASRAALRKRGHDLVKALGFTVTHLGTNTSLLSAGRDRRAVAVFLDEGESFEAPGMRFEGVSPVSHALALASREQLPWVVLTRGPEIRLYAVKPDVGVGRRGPSQTFIEANLALVPEDRAGFLQLLFSADALTVGGSFDQILDSSADFASDLATRLRDRVYRKAVPALAEGVAASLTDTPSREQLVAAYDQTLNVLFRLLFVAYGEDKDLLPYRSNSRYADHSLKRIARRLAEDANRDALSFDDDNFDLWEDVVQLWDAVRLGNPGWGVPAYNGGLFSTDPATNPAGAALQDIRLSNAHFGPALAALLIDVPDDGDDLLGPVDFRSLSVREFGTLYEGLLESELSLAPTDLSVDGDGNFVPAGERGVVEVAAGAVYLHNKSGERKATGSYFTKPFGVEHLLDQALEPALTQHLDRIQTLVDAGDDAAAAKAFFDFRCADIAMGSGHFLVAAVDRIEARLSAFLALHPIPTVTADLDALRTAALNALGELADGVEIEMTALLRRQVGRRCIYGVDRNVIAVELARLAIWIHTFVPGLPLSFLDHNLVTGNSLIGIASIDDALRVLAGDDDDAPTLYRDEITEFLERGAAALARLATIDDATVADVHAAQQAHHNALAAVEPAALLFDVLIAARLEDTAPPVSVDEESIRAAAEAAGARAAAEEVAALHFPVVFPEVFLRERPGFDCLLGNPPWDKVLFEPQQFWVTRMPGLNALPQSQRANRIEQLRVERPADAVVEAREKAERERFQGYVERSYPLRGRGHYDFAKLFTERALTLLHRSAALGYVLPANSLLLGGWSRIREALLTDSATTVAQARNKAGWLFDDVHNSTAVAFIGRHRTGESATVLIWPGLATQAALRSAGSGGGLTLNAKDLNELSDTMVVPWLNSAADRPVFETMQAHHSLSSDKGWVSGSHDARYDFRSSGPQRRFSSDTDSDGAWRILMTRHVVAYGIDDTIAFQRFISDPAALPNGVTAVDGVAGFDESHPVVIMRHPSRNDDSRTMIATALPRAGFVHNKGYVHAVKHAGGTGTAELLALLGFLNTFTCDWWVRRFVDRHVTAPVVNNVRLPDWSAEQIERAAELAAALLREQGQDTLAADRVLPTTEGDPVAARVELEALAAAGFGLQTDQMRTLLSDFSDGAAACPAPLRTAILEATR
ncbi:hypothetical protein MGALJ_60550 (plasmid) [Mycobacterium gallinarum]|uniref:site-specific DNA-methyltransferase (adenine-specific) n=1 Tax=Mycobacterium gallinarum TaxID=39689 RepID=A0A9W4FIP0_9MYCO|nr:hypothetical protein [Mycobacterium gallinarum]BBY96386.1 hypothetical protein MGALJ_60550 [Mycobacterium gallinarum]